jgi:TetR/AcrR family transcriptional repressor of mexJK operon
MSESETLSPEKRAQVLAGASAVFARDGYEGASMSRIAQEAGVSKGTLYNYYASKAELFAAFVDQQCSANLAQLFAATPSGDNSPGAVLHSIGSRMLAMMLSPTGLTIYRVVTSEATKFPALARCFYEAGPARAIGALAAWLADETNAGRLAVDDPVFAAEQFFALCQSHVCLRRILQLESGTSPEEVTKVVDRAVAMFLRTYEAPA